jgi:hypothetical protein
VTKTAECVWLSLKLNQSQSLDHLKKHFMIIMNYEKEQLKVATDLAATLTKKNLSLNFKDNPSLDSQLLLTLVLQKENEVLKLKNSIQEKEFKLSESQTHSAVFVTPISGSSNKIEPKLLPIILSSVLIGAGVGLILLVLRRAKK